jgi:hypothetical protein
MVVVIYRKSENCKKKCMVVFKSQPNADRIIDGGPKRQLLPEKYIIDEIGVGSSFIETYKKLHKIKNYEIIN